MEASPTLPNRVLGALRDAGVVSIAVLVLGVLGGLALIVAELSPVITIEVLTTGTCQEIADAQVRDACRLDGLEQHGGALILLGALAIVMALGAGPGILRPHGLGSVRAVVLVLAIAVTSFLLLGVAGLVVLLVPVIGRVPGGSRPAALALLVVAVAVAILLVVLDLPKTDETGLVGIRYEQAEAGPDIGLYLAALGAALCAAAGALGLAPRSTERH